MVDVRVEEGKVSQSRKTSVQMRVVTISMSTAISLPCSTSTILNLHVIECTKNFYFEKHVLFW